MSPSELYRCQRVCRYLQDVIAAYLPLATVFRDAFLLSSDRRLQPKMVLACMTASLEVLIDERDRSIDGFIAFPIELNARYADRRGERRDYQTALSFACENGFTLLLRWLLKPDLRGNEPCAADVLK